jgi:glycosyltransferase involved in cell wall biosynthesis
MLAIVETHPVQYHAPVYRALHSDLGIPCTAIYGSDFSIAGYNDREFNASFAWDSDLLAGYESIFLSRVATGGASTDADVTTDGLSGALQRLNPSSVLLLGYSPRFYREVCVAALRLGRPLLFRAETTDHARGRGKIKSWIRDRALKLLYARCAKLLYVGRRSKEHFIRLGIPESKLLFSPYCVDTSPFELGPVAREALRAQTRAELKINSSDRVIVFSGKLSPRKGPDLLLQAVKSLPSEERDRVVLLFLGDGELKESLKNLAAQESRVTAHFVGFQNQKRLSRYYHAGDLLVLPSIWSETWGLVVNDALCHGLPCVISDVVGCADDLVLPGKTGEVFSSGSPNELAGALSRALKLAGRADVQQACRERAEAYSVRCAAEGIARAYNSVAVVNRAQSRPLAVHA